jgi:hypothetical protein
LLLDANDSFNQYVAGSVCTLGMNDRDVWTNRRNCGEDLACERALYGSNVGTYLGEIDAFVASEYREGKIAAPAS